MKATDYVGIQYVSFLHKYVDLCPSLIILISNLQIRILLI